MDVPSLKNITFNTVLLHLWKNSELPMLIANYAAKKRCKNVFKEPFINKHFILIERELEKISDKISETAHVPWAIKTKVLVALNGLNASIKDFALTAAANGLKRNTIKNLKLLILNVVLTINGDIDASKTILNVMKESNFDVMFNKDFPGKFCVDQSKIIDAFFDFKEHITISQLQKDAKKIQRIERDVRSIIDPLSFWDTFIIKLSEGGYNNMTSMSQLQFAAWIGNIDALNLYYCYHSEIEFEISQPKALEHAAKYALQKFSLYEHTIVFFYENLEPRVWNELLHDNFQAIFHCLLGSWNYRYLCLKFFKDVKMSLDIKTYKSLLSRIGFTWYQSKFEYYDVIQIIQSIWLDTPENFKEDYDVSFVIIPEIILIKCDFGYLPHFISCYDKEKQIEVLGLLMFGLIISSKKNLIKQILTSVETLGPHFSNHMVFLTLEVLKKFLLIEARKSYSICFENLENIKNFMIDNEAGEAALLNDVFHDRDFIVEFLVQISRKRDMNLFLEWGFKNNRQIDDYIKCLLKNGWINDAYDQRLIENENIETAHEIFEILGIDKKQIFVIEQSVCDNPDVISSVLINLLESDNVHYTDKYLPWFFPNNKEEKAFMEYFLLYSGHGLRAIHDFFFRVANLLVGTGPVLKEPWDLMDLLITIKNSWLKDYDLVSKFESVLHEKGHPNLNPFKIKIKDQNLQKLKQCRIVVDSLYRGFRAILQESFQGIYFAEYDHTNLSNLSARMVADTNIDVESVL